MASSRRKCYPMTIVHLFFYSALGCLLPFLNLQARDLGLNTFETSMANIAAALISGLGAFGVVYLSTRCCGRLKILPVCFMLLSAVAYTSLIVVPWVIRLPRLPLLEFDCSSAIRLEKCSNWESCSDATLTSSNLTSFKLSDCRHTCSSQQTIPYTLHVCFRSEEGNLCEVYDSNQVLNTTVDFQSRFPAWYFDELGKVPASEFLNYDSEISTDFVDVCSFKPVWPLVVNDKNYDDIYCRPVPEGCQVKCRVAIEGDRGPSECMEVLGDPVFTFWVYLVVRALADTFLLSSVGLLDALFVLGTNDYNGFYGRSRVWPAFGLVIFPAVTGVLIDYYSSIAGRPDYSPAMFIFDGLILVTCVVLIAVQLDLGVRGQYQVNSPSKRRPFWSLELGVLFVIVFVLGTQWGVLDTFLRPFHAEIGCNKLTIGASAGLPFLCSVPFLIVAKNLVRNIGKANLLVFAFLFYGIRFAGTSFVSYPYWTIPFQAMETFTLIIAWIAIVAYAHSLVSRRNRLLVHFILYFLHFSPGRALGTLIGVFLEEEVGLAWTFRGFAIFSTFTGFLYLLLHHTCIKKRHRRRRSNRGASNGSALFPMAERRPNGDALHQKEAASQANTPMINSDDEDVK